LWFFFLAYCLAFSIRDFAGTSMGSLGSLFLQKARSYDATATGLALSGIYLAGTISNPLFGSLSDRGRKRWLTVALLMAAGTMAIFPWVPQSWTVPVYVVYGFFFLAGYPMTEAALMESVPDAVRGRVFGIYVMIGGVIGNLSHWLVGAKVKQLGPAASLVSSYYPIYAGLALMLLSRCPVCYASIRFASERGSGLAWSVLTRLRFPHELAQLFPGGFASRGLAHPKHDWRSVPNP
jgi:MFS family permease